jgi:PiT family inorganic phosphate transporter
MDLGDLSWLTLTTVAIGLLTAFAFEFINGFHDTANAVATVIYTNSMKPVPAVVWSGIWNLLGLLHASTLGLAVAFSIVQMLPVDLVVESGTFAGTVMVLSMMVTAIAWNLGTWYVGLPASSSHTLIGSVLGVGLAGSLLQGNGILAGMHWPKVIQVFTSLLVSPLIGFSAAALLVFLGRRLLRDERLFRAPEGSEPPPLWIRGLLLFTCTGVSFAHGSNDGQKGVGLVMLILVGSLPGAYALNPTFQQKQMTAVIASLDEADALLAQSPSSPLTERNGGSHLRKLPEDRSADWRHVPLAKEPLSDRGTIRLQIALVRQRLEGKTTVADIPEAERWHVRSDLLRLREAFRDYVAEHPEIQQGGKAQVLARVRARLVPLTEFAPRWVVVAVALALGIGTMVGWKRIVVTVGEKIGETHLTYGQGAAAELVAMATIFSADRLGLPVSTTHVLNAGVAGTMKANGSGLQPKTVRNIALAWVLTLPVCMTASAVIFWLGMHLCH